MAEAIEFALTLPIFRILLSEPLEYGWWFDQPEVTKAIHINTNFQDVVTGIRDADVASESLIDDMMTGVRDVGGTAGPGDTGSNVNNPLDQMGFTNPSNDVVTNDLQTSWKGSWDKFSIKPSNDEFDGVTATQLQENVQHGCFEKGGQLGYTEVEWTYIGDNVGSTAGPGGSTFTTGYAEAVGLDGYMIIGFDSYTVDGEGNNP